MRHRIDDSKIWGATVRKAVPEAVEGIGYRMPGYKLHGQGLFELSNPLVSCRATLQVGGTVSEPVQIYAK